MNTLQASNQRSDLTTLRILAELLERLDRSKVPVDAGQYAAVASRLSQALRAVKSDEALGTLLASHPAAAELYENTRYEAAGLCRSPLEKSVAAEQKARAAIQFAMQSPKESSANGQS